MLPPPTLWEKITGWRGSFLVLSILFHVILIAIAAFLVVQVVKGREKLKFTAPPPTQANKSQEHKVQMAKKKTSMSAPSISKRITSTAVNTSIALPAVQMSSSSSPDLMSSVMSGMGGSGLGAGFGASGGGGALGGGKLTAFGFKSGGKGLEGTFYDIKQAATSHPPARKIASGAKIQAVLQEFFQKGWNKDVLKKYFSPNVKMRTVRVFIPVLGPEEATRAFEVEKEVEKSQWVILYSGSVIAPKNGKFRFRGRGDNILAVRITKGGVSQNVFFDSAGGFARDVKLFPGCQNIKNGQPPGTSGDPKNKRPNETSVGPWFEVKTGEEVQVDILMGELPGTNFEAILMIEEEGKTYAPAGSYPVFEMAQGIDPVKIERMPPPVATERVIFRAK